MVVVKNMLPEPSHICLIAGEPSGDVLGSQLIDQLLERFAQVKISGVGGPHMASSGCETILNQNDLAVMGIAEVLPKIPKILSHIQKCVDYIIAHKPEIIITIDSPDFCFRVVKALKRKGYNRSLFIHYVAPTVWAWRPERAARIAKLYDGLICLFPFEPAYFEAEGLRSCFAGHPVIDIQKQSVSSEPLMQELGLDKGRKTLGLLFGSRIAELNRTGPAIRDAAYRLSIQNKDLQILVPTLPHLKREVGNFMQEFKVPVHILDNRELKWSAFNAMDLALAVSGTVGLELAVADVPHLIAYKMNWLTWLIIQKKLNISSAHLANIIMDEQVVPEFIQDSCKPDKIYDSLELLFHDDLQRARQKKSFSAMRKKITSPEGTSAQCAAHFIETIYYSRSDKGIYERESGPV
jgi:lipid-A-disaccharide synthase